MLVLRFKFLKDQIGGSVNLVATKPLRHIERFIRQFQKLVLAFCIFRIRGNAD
jgi:hypothetical protein